MLLLLLYACGVVIWVEVGDSLATAKGRVFTDDHDHDYDGGEGEGVWLLACFVSC